MAYERIADVFLIAMSCDYLCGETFVVRDLRVRQEGKERGTLCLPVQVQVPLSTPGTARRRQALQHVAGKPDDKQHGLLQRPQVGLKCPPHATRIVVDAGTEHLDYLRLVLQEPGLGLAALGVCAENGRRKSLAGNEAPLVWPACASSDWAFPCSGSGPSPVTGPWQPTANSRSPCRETPSDVAKYSPRSLDCRLPSWLPGASSMPHRLFRANAST